MVDTCCEFYWHLFSLDVIQSFSFPRHYVLHTSLISNIPDMEKSSWHLPERWLARVFVYRCLRVINSFLSQGSGFCSGDLAFVSPRLFFSFYPYISHKSQPNVRRIYRTWMILIWAWWYIILDVCIIVLLYSFFVNLGDSILMPWGPGMGRNFPKGSSPFHTA